MGTEVSKEGSDQVGVDPKSEYIDEVLQREVDDTEDETDGYDEFDGGLSDVDKLAQTIDPKEYLDQYPFKNLIFEGGGAKGIAYPGALKISYEELVSFIEETGISVVHRRLGFGRQQVNTLLSLLQTLYNTMSLNIVRISVRASDVPRTVGLNSHYIGTLTFDYTKEDADFVGQESYNTTMTFLKNFMAKILMERKTKA